jgi:Ala-tRNA(Pro) deacylase
VEDQAMPGIAARLQRFFDEEDVGYERIHHHADYTAKQTAVDTETPAQEFAKTVFIWIDGRYAMAVLPANQLVVPSKICDALEAKEVRLATEEDAARLCPDCDVGAAPPFGNLYDLPVYVSPSLTEDERITFNAGSHEEAVRMAYRDFEKLVQPHVIPLSDRD